MLRALRAGLPLVRGRRDPNAWSVPDTTLFDDLYGCPFDGRLTVDLELAADGREPFTRLEPLTFEVHPDFVGIEILTLWEGWTIRVEWSGWIS